MKKYTINYHTGAGDQEVEVHNLDEAKKIAYEGMAYTQTNVSIEDENGNTVAISTWYGYPPEEWAIEEGLVLAQFGDWGYYSNWENPAEWYGQSMEGKYGD